MVAELPWGNVLLQNLHLVVSLICGIKRYFVVSQIQS